MRSYAVLTFLSALLLFTVQPLLARAALPWFGGAASVWTTSLLFYQTLLFAGYAYAHLGRRLGVRRQALLHVSLVALSLLLLPVTPAEAWKPVGPDWPTLRLLGLLSASVGLPYLLLAGTTPLLHDWFGRNAPERSPYRLYAVSNAGSLLALLAYPALVEPLMAVRFQGVAWSWVYASFALGLAWLVWGIARARASGPAAARSDEIGSPPPTLVELLFWGSLAACGTGLLMAITNTITMDLASVPLLWVVPLALYLATFILAFGGAYRRSTWGAFLVLGLGAAAVLWAGGFALPVVVQIVLGCGVLVAGCMVCHGELARTTPHASHLTVFYLTMAGGGALGGLAVAIVAPAVLADLYEFPGFVLLAYALLVVAMRRDPGSVLRGPGALPAGIVLGSVGVLALAGFVLPTLHTMDGTLATERNFYGVLRVQDRPAGATRGRDRTGRGYACGLEPARRHLSLLRDQPGGGAAGARALHVPRRRAGRRSRSRARRWAHHARTRAGHGGGWTRVPRPGRRRLLWRCRARAPAHARVTRTLPACVGTGRCTGAPDHEPAR